eukprot:TRINITY_DN12181_c0_g1_i5.p1 TRINITY_DN12181_c0_g1~~TRINITY_DN12181_c0_g1_i5.p1  ORF type:complete len:514 (+),score=98.17 TRINITY_DN12181_c0_g1_i5:189-1730(+)
MQNLITELNMKLQEALYQGPKHHQERHKKSGKLLPRERLELILDPDTPFLELLPLAGCKDKNNPATIVCGIGIVSGVECAIISYIATIKGGATNEITLRKNRRIAEIAEQNHLPCLVLMESAGADLRRQSQVFHAGGASFKWITRRSKAGLPTISVVFGSSTAGGAYAPGLSDYVIMVKNQARVFLAGPPLVKMATGEEIDAETLGGAEMHSKISGVSDYLAEDEYHGIYLARQVVANINYSKKTALPLRHLKGPITEPIYDPDEILGIVGPDIRKPFNAKEVIARIVDGSRFHEWKPDYAKTLICCWAEIHGFLVGILANNGVLFSETSNKGAHFIHLCDKRGIPLLFLQNITGFMVGRKQEHEGIIKHGSKLINAVSNAVVPAITIIMGASYGAGNYAMCGRAYDPRFLFSWPNSKVAVMGSDQLVGVLTTIARDAATKGGKTFDEQKLPAANKMFKAQVEAESSAYYVSSECLDDGIIDPRNTRSVLGFCLSVIYNGPVQPGGAYGISRL